MDKPSVEFFAKPPGMGHLLIVMIIFFTVMVIGLILSKNNFIETTTFALVGVAEGLYW